MDRILPVILAGGAGTRLWPLSSEERPKPFHALAGEASLFRQTLERAADPRRFAPPLIVAGAPHRELVAAELEAAGIAAAAVILEPQGRNTAPAIAAALLLARQRDLGGHCLVMPSDHSIRRADRLLAGVDLARAAAASGALVTYGIEPCGPETSYGYIKLGKPWPQGPSGVFAVERFVEKPARAIAEAMLDEGGFLWNSGMFLLPVEAALAEMRRLTPALVAGAERSLTGATAASGFIHPDARAFSQLESISIDYALMERTSRAAVVPVDPGWSDVGSWTAVWDIAPRDAAANVVVGDVLLHDVANSLVRSEGATTTAVVGLSDVIVVNTGKAVIVAAKDRAQDIRRIAEAIRKRERGGR